MANGMMNEHIVKVLHKEIRIFPILSRFKFQIVPVFPFLIVFQTLMNLNNCDCGLFLFHYYRLKFIDFWFWCEAFVISNLLVIFLLVSKCTTITRSSSYIKVKQTSKDCFNTQLAVGDTCSFECEKGFLLSQPFIECWLGSLAVGKWSIDTNKEVPSCTGDWFISLIFFKPT